jgi:hypothetical protein
MDCAGTLTDKCVSLIGALISKGSLDPDLIWNVLRPILRLLLWLVPEHVPSSETLAALTTQSVLQQVASTRTKQAAGPKQGDAAAIPDAEDRGTTLAHAYISAVATVSRRGLHAAWSEIWEVRAMQAACMHIQQASLALRPSLSMVAAVSAAPSLPPPLLDTCRVLPWLQVPLATVLCQAIACQLDVSEAEEGADITPRSQRDVEQAFFWVALFYRYLLIISSGYQSITSACMLPNPDQGVLGWYGAAVVFSSLPRREGPTPCCSVVFLYTGRLRTLAYEMSLNAGGPGGPVQVPSQDVLRKLPFSPSSMPFFDFVWYILAGERTQ